MWFKPVAPLSSDRDGIGRTDFMSGGASEIGGNKVLIEDRGTKVIFDLGNSVSAERNNFVVGIVPRRANGVGDYLELDLLSRLERLYDRRTYYPMGATGLINIGIGAMLEILFLKLRRSGRKQIVSPVRGLRKIVCN